MDDVVPFGQDGMARQSHICLRVLGYLDLGRVEFCVQRCAETKTSVRPSCADVLQHHFVTGQRFAGSIGADQIKHAVIDRVPLGGALDNAQNWNDN